MIVVPALLPVTIPDASTDALAGRLLVHTPPDGVELKVVVLPIQVFKVPDMLVGVAFTVTFLVLLQLVLNWYVIATVPAPMPVITLPVALATAALLLLQVPPAGELEKIVVRPVHTVAVPVMSVGRGFTVTTCVLLQLPPSEWVMVVVPAAIPVTTPVIASTVALAITLLLHVPPLLVLFKVIAEATHTLAGPVIAACCEITVTVFGVNAIAQPPPGGMYEIVAEPTPIGVAIPLEPIVATSELLLLQVPPAGTAAKAPVEPVQISDGPVNVSVPAALTFTVAVAISVPHSFVVS